MPFYDPTDAVYGFGVYGQARYGVVAPTVSLVGVSATGLVREPHLDSFEIDVTEKVYDGASATGGIGYLSLHVVERLESAPATASIGLVSPNIALLTGSVEAYEATGSVQVNLSEVLESVSATFTINAEGLSVRSINRVNISGPDVFGQIGTPEPQVREYVSGVSATVATSQTKQNLRKTLQGVSASSSVGVLTNSNSTRLTSSATLSGIGDTKENVVERVSGPQLVSGVGVPTHSITKRLSNVVMVSSIGDTSETGIIFNFEAVKDLYSRQRTITISRAA